MMKPPSYLSTSQAPYCPEGYVVTDSGIKRKVPKPHTDVSGRLRRKRRKIENKYCAGLVQMAIDAQ